jgi:hypothetical protein
VIEEDVRQVARKIAAFHAEARGGTEVALLGDINAVRQNIQENFKQTERFVGVTTSQADYDDLVAYNEAFLECCADVFERRAREGRIRDGHGDLHAANIFLDDGIHVIDCIEFNDRLRCGDVAEDIAFLAMDLDHFGRRDLSDALIREYVGVSGDHGVPCLLEFFKCYRAYVRGKVTSFRLDDSEMTDEERERAVDEARSYFELAARYARKLPRPMVVMVAGLSGSGKSSVAESLASHWGLEHVSSDVTRKALAGIAPNERQYVGYDQGIYSAEFTRRTMEAMVERAREMLLAGKSVVLDATYRSRCDRETAAAMTRRLGVPLYYVECAANEDETRRRLMRRESGVETTASDGRWEIYLQQRARWEPIVEADPERYIRLDTSGPVPATFANLLKQFYLRALGCY